MATEVIMPSLGESVYEGTIAGWLKKEGDKVRQYEPLLEIETDKVTTEATAEIAGTLLKIVVREGETVEVGTVLAYLGSPDEQVEPEIRVGDKELVASETQSETVPVPAAPVLAAQNQTAPPAAPVSTQPAMSGPGQARPGRYTGRISPVVGRIVDEHNIDLELVLGTGREGRITKRDILAYIKQRDGEPDTPQTVTTPIGVMLPPSRPVQEQTVSAAVPGEILSLSKMRRVIAEHMVRSKQTSPHVTTVFDIDFTAVAAHRSANKERFARDGANLTFTVYIVAALVQALKAHPMVNSSWTDQGISLKKEINVGVAAAISEGLIVPVIKDADRLSLLGLARSINDLAGRARANRLLPDEVQGGTFTLTNHGISGSLFATPIINQPQCGILGVGKIEKRVKVINDGIAIRLMAYASLTFDHRILDGAIADAFMTTIKVALEGWS